MEFSVLSERHLYLIKNTIKGEQFMVRSCILIIENIHCPTLAFSSREIFSVRNHGYVLNHLGKH